MDSKYASKIISELTSAGVDVCVDGGWGIDALMGRETRRHNDLDMSINSEQLKQAIKVFSALGFEHNGSAKPGMPARYVMKDDLEREVDVHPIQIDGQGNGWQKLSEKGDKWGFFPAGSRNSKGTINGVRVQFLAPGIQYRFKMVHEPRDIDKHDLKLLAEHFKVGPVELNEKR